MLLEDLRFNPNSQTLRMFLCIHVYVVISLLCLFLLILLEHSWEEKRMTSFHHDDLIMTAKVG